MQNIVIKKMPELDYRSSEAFKKLRTNLQFAGAEVKAILFTSCIPNDGKSFTSLNTAMSFAALGKKVLYIDADLRHSVLVNEYKITGCKNGLTHLLTGMSELNDVVCQTKVDNLHCIVAGPTPPNPSELLGGKIFDGLIKWAKNNYDYVIVDTPPMANVVDAAVVANFVDASVLIIAAKAVDYRMASEVVEQLQNAKASFLGVVLNKVDMSENSVYGKYYGKYYGQYYGNSDNE